MSTREPRRRIPGRRPASRCSGVTLIELMIVVVVVAILGLIALPSYRQYTIRAHRTEAKSALLRLHANQERWYLQHNSYSDDPAALGFVNDATENGVYVLTIEPDPAGLTQGYVATARPRAGGGANGVNMTDDADCAEFRITSDGLTTASPDTAKRCW